MKAEKDKDRSRLIAAAMGRYPCDLSIVNIRLVNVITGEIYPAAVDICDGVIVRVRESGSDTGDAKALKTFDGKGNYLIPGLIDTHVHVESTMMTPENFAWEVIPWGTTTVISDPHEIANVMGVDGIGFMLESARRAPLRHYMLAPPCVPSMPGKENSGSEFSKDEIAYVLEKPEIIGIAELMNYRDVCNDTERMHQIIEEGIVRNVFLQGHAPRLSGNMLMAYRLAGPMSDHECRSSEEAVQKTRLGFHVNLKISSLSNHLKETVSAAKSQRWNDNVSLCTDDVHAQVIYAQGHLNRVIRKAIEYGAEPLEAYRFATYNAAREYGFEDLGAIAPGYAADLQLLEELDGRRPDFIWIRGRQVTKGSTLVVTAQSTVQLGYIQKEEDLCLKAPEKCVKTLVILSKSDGPFNRSNYEELQMEHQYVKLERDPDLAFICVCNRYGKEKKTISVIRNFGVTSGAFAVTVAHDCHNLVMVYRNTKDALVAVKEIERMQGGMALVIDGKIICTLPLPIGGIMSPLPCEELAPMVEKMEEAVATYCSGNSLLKLATAALPVLPGTIITDEGVLDGENREFIPLFKIEGER